MLNNPLVELGIAAVRSASEVCRRVQSRLVQGSSIEKKDKSPVTVADFASQAVVCSILQGSTPPIPVVGEEDATELRNPEQAAIRAKVVEQVSIAAGRQLDDETVLGWIDLGNASPAARFWTLDPIDGTKGFLRGEQYAIALALIEDGQVTLGIMGCPNLPDAKGQPGVLFVARKGQGTLALPLWEPGIDGSQPVKVSSITDPKQARFTESVESGHSDQSASVRIARLLGITTDAARMDSQAKYGVVARGEASIYLRLPTRGDYVENIWDHAAGMLVVEEAGGKVTDLSGKPLDFGVGAKLKNNKGVVATNRHIHGAVLAAAREVLAQEA